MYTYPVTLTPDDNGTVLVGFPDFAFAHSFGEDESEALAHAVDALESAMTALMAQRAAIPRPSKPARGQLALTLPALAASKVALYEAVIDKGWSKAELARRLGWHVNQVQRLLDLRHASKIEQVEAALAALGKRLVVDLVAA